MTNPFLADVAAPPIGQAALWAAAYDGSHGPLINLSQAVPGHAPPPELAMRLAEAAGTASAARYGPVLGDDALRTAYAGHVSALYGATVGAAEVGITAGCNQAFFTALMTLARTGDAVILPGPAYFNHTMTLEMLGIEARLVETTAATGFVPTVAAIERLIDGTVKAVALVSPNNPTGAIYPPALLAEVFALCQRKGIALILDETYRDFLPPGDAAPHGLLALPGWQETLIGLYSFSKSYAIPGHRLGAIIAGEAFLAQAEKVLDCVQICAPRPPQAAVEWAIPALADWRAAMTAEILARAKTFRETLAPFPGWRIEQMGAYFAYVRHPFPGRTDVSEILARKLGVVTLPGSFFGPGQENHLRIAFANVSAERIATLAERLPLAEALFAGGAGLAAAPQTALA